MAEPTVAQPDKPEPWSYWFLSTGLIVGFLLACAGLCYLAGWSDTAGQFAAGASAMLLLRLLLRLGQYVQRRRNVQRRGSMRILWAWAAGTFVTFLAVLATARYTGDNFLGALAVISTCLLMLGCLVAVTLEVQRIERDRSGVRSAK